MKIRLAHYIFIILLAIGLLGCTLAPTENAPASRPTSAPTGAFETATVIKVVDGDTIEVLLKGKQYRVRYVLVNTPETHHPTKGVEPFGPEATEANRRLVAGKTLRLEKDVSETDQYGRLLRYVYVDDLLVNEELLRLGMAQVSTFPPDVKYVDRFLAAQRAAQEAGVGMWAGMRSGIEIVNVDVYDEYVDIQNKTSPAQDFTGWTLVSQKGDQRCELAGNLLSGDTLRVWARAQDADKGGYNCGFSQGIWSNSAPDPAVLLDEDGLVISRFE
ncbi:MAG TPA: hypothetical protein G4N96_05015 [Chloroflexi bacterium]|nr:hypothetical protein [Chloroflexota bacterium]